MIRAILSITCLVLVAMVYGCREQTSANPSVEMKDSPAEKHVLPSEVTTAAEVAKSPDSKESNATVIAYYFHRTVRCHSCLTIEAWSREAVEQAFVQLMEDGRLVWLALNIEKPENRKFVEDFQLDTSTLVVADIRNAKPVRWKKLEKVWKLIGDEAAFTQYVQDEVSRYLQSE